MTSKFHAFSLGCVAAALAWPTQAAVVKLDFEAIGLAAPSTGTAVLNSFSSDGLSFSANALAFHKGVIESPDRNDTNSAIVTRAGNYGYVRSPFGSQGFTSFQIDIAGKNYDQFALTFGVAALDVEIYAYDANDNVLNSGAHLFSNAGGFAWKTAYTLVDGTAKANIKRITFDVTTRGIFAIDDLQFGEAGTGGGGGGGKVPEPAGLGLLALALAAAGVASRRGKPA